MHKVGTIAVLCGLLAGAAVVPAAANEHARDVVFHKDSWYAQAFTTGGSPLHRFSLTDIKVRFGHKSGEPGPVTARIFTANGANPGTQVGANLTIGDDTPDPRFVGEFGVCDCGCGDANDGRR